jgi:hypothetical protein
VDRADQLQTLIAESSGRSLEAREQHALRSGMHRRGRFVRGAFDTPATRRRG